MGPVVAAPVVGIGSAAVVGAVVVPGWLALVIVGLVGSLPLELSSPQAGARAVSRRRARGRRMIA
jgi:hypothetical protein